MLFCKNISIGLFMSSIKISKILGLVPHSINLKVFSIFCRISKYHNQIEGTRSTTI